MSDEPIASEQKTERFNMFMSPSELKAIEDWSWKNRIRSKSEAVRRLCQIGVVYDAHEVDLIKRSERALKSLLVTFDRLSKDEIEKIPRMVRAGLAVSIEEQLEAYKLATKVGIASGFLSSGSGDVADLMKQAHATAELVAPERR